MTHVRRRRSARPGSSEELASLLARVEEAEQTLQAIQSGGVDALVVSGRHGPRVYTLEGADHAYRVLIEAMNEGALTLTEGAVILYANQSFARIVKRPIELIMGYSFERLLPAADRATFLRRLRRTAKPGFRLQVVLSAGDGSLVPAQVSIRPLPKNGSDIASFGMVVTDMTESQRSREMLRVLTHRLAQAQESERGRVALELTDNVTQLLVVILLRLQTLVNQFPEHDWPPREEVLKLKKLLSEVADEVERISRDLQPSIVKNLGLAAALRDATNQFAKRTGLSVEISCPRLSPPPPVEVRLALYRIFEEALRNVEQHAGARHVSVRLTQGSRYAELEIKDDGAGFDSHHIPAEGSGEKGWGLLRVRERVEFLGGRLTIKPGARGGTELKVRIPLPGRGAATR